MVLKAHLDYFVAEAEHDGMLGSHPLLHIDYVLTAQTCDLCALAVVDVSRLAARWPSLHAAYFISFKVGPEMLEQGHLLL